MPMISFAETRRAKKIKYNKERYEELKKRGICVSCGCANADEGRVLCLACRMAQSESARYRGYSEKRKAYQREKQKEKYYQRKEAGICVRCNQNKAIERRIICPACRIKQAIYDRRRSKRKIKPEGTCYFCQEKAVAGYKVCAKHLENAREASKKGVERSREVRKNNGHIWEMDNKILFH